MVGVSYFRSYHLFKGMSITEAQLKAIADGFLSTLGESKGNGSELQMNVMEKVLLNYGGDFVKAANENLIKNKSIASGNIADIKIQYKKFGTEYILSLGYPNNEPAAKYYDFVNKGVMGTKNEKADSKTPYKFNISKKSIPVNVVQGWLKYNKLKAVASDVKKYGKLGQEQKAIDGGKSLAWAVAKSIHRKGLRSTHYFDNARDTTFGKDFLNIMTKALGEDVKISITQSFYGDNNTK